MKTKEMESLLNELSNSIYGRARTGDVCVQCGSKEVKSSDFRNEVSRKEFLISHWCQKCQDSFYGAEDEALKDAPSFEDIAGDAIDLISRAEVLRKK